jgi:hypothetical protein
LHCIGLFTIALASCSCWVLLPTEHLAKLCRASPRATFEAQAREL